MWEYKNPIACADLRRILVSMRCKMSEAEVISQIAYLLEGLDFNDGVVE